MKVVFSPHDDSDFLILAIWKLDVLPFPVEDPPTKQLNIENQHKHIKRVEINS